VTAGPDFGIAKFVGRSRAAQGLGPTVTDTTVLARLAEILMAGRDNAPKGGAVDNILTCSPKQSNRRPVTQRRSP
jgi:hypothetical protein